MEDYIAASDMESLVNLVLRGRGDELVDKRSHNPEIQEFLNNVPAYMAKISSIHNAAHTGNMRDLQSLLGKFQEIGCFKFGTGNEVILKCWL